MIKITTWRPDHCDCAINYWWDDSVDPKVRVHNYVHPSDLYKVRPDAFAPGSNTSRHTGSAVSERLCKHHVGLVGQAIYDTLLEENSRKNIAIDLIAQRDPNYGNLKVPPAIFDRDAYVWSFDDGTRLLHVSHPALKTSSKKAVQRAMDSRFGPGKVVVE